MERAHLPKSGFIKFHHKLTLLNDYKTCKRHKTRKTFFNYFSGFCEYNKIEWKGHIFQNQIL